MYGRPPFRLPESTVPPPWGWSRRQLIARSSLWFSVVPRVFKPIFLDLCRGLARSGRAYHTVVSLKWPLADLHLFGEQLQSELLGGSGIVYVVGLCTPESDLPDEVLRWAYLLIGLQLGAPVSPATLLLDITARNLCSRPSLEDPGPGVQTETAFHTDSAPDGGAPDLVGTLCLRPARQGGQYQVTSALRARDLLWERRRDLLAELYEPLIRQADRTSLDRPGPTGRPVFAQHAGATGLRFDYGRSGIETGCLRAGQPLRPRQQQALDQLDQALSDPTGCMQFQMRRGDMLFVNNNLVAHNRRPFDDGPGDSRRLMVRMWLGR